MLENENSAIWQRLPDKHWQDDTLERKLDEYKVLHA